MQTKQFGPKALKFKALQDFAVIVQSATPPEALQALQALQSNPLFTGKAWQANFAKLKRAMLTDNPEFSIFGLSGNSKLPFISFSTLPGVTCPGAGKCLEFCYSFRAWRYPAAFARMAQNAYFMRFNRYAISREFDHIVAKRPEGFDFRLYVDGDFASVGDLHFWMTHIKAAPMVRAYGYSKSFAILLGYDAAGHKWPTNYMLNLSSGHNATPMMLNYVKALPIVRGEFIAVSIGKKVKSTDHGKPETNKALREVFGQKAFTCPGTCGNCTGAGHACGMPKLKGLPIIIAMH